MSSQILGFFCINGITTVSIMYIYKYIIDIFRNEDEINDDNKICYLENKICNLERQINSLNQVIEEIEDKYLKKENHMMKSTCELNSRLEEFINYNYNVLE